MSDPCRSFARAKVVQHRVVIVSQGREQQHRHAERECEELVQAHEQRWRVGSCVRERTAPEGPERYGSDADACHLDEHRGDAESQGGPGQHREEQERDGLILARIEGGEQCQREHCQLHDELANPPNPERVERHDPETADQNDGAHVRGGNRKKVRQERHVLERECRRRDRAADHAAKHRGAHKSHHPAGSRAPLDAVMPAHDRQHHERLGRAGQPEA